MTHDITKSDLPRNKENIEWWAGAWQKKYRALCWMPKGQQRAIAYAAARFAMACRRELTKERART